MIAKKLTGPFDDNAGMAWYFGMIHRVNGYTYLRFFLMPYYGDVI